MISKLIVQIFKFGIVGFFAFIIDYSVMVVLTEYIGFFYLISSTISFIVSLAFNYIFSMKFVFKRKEDFSRRREFFLFSLLSIIGLFINQISMWFLVEKLYITYKFGKIIATIIVMIWNFVSRKIFLENHK